MVLVYVYKAYWKFSKAHSRLQSMFLMSLGQTFPASHPNVLSAIPSSKQSEINGRHYIRTIIKNVDLKVSIAKGLPLTYGILSTWKGFKGKQPRTFEISILLLMSYSCYSLPSRRSMTVFVEYFEKNRNN